MSPDWTCNFITVCATITLAAAGFKIGFNKYKTDEHPEHYERVYNVRMAECVEAYIQKQNFARELGVDTTFDTTAYKIEMADSVKRRADQDMINGMPFNQFIAGATGALIGCGAGGVGGSVAGFAACQGIKYLKRKREEEATTMAAPIPPSASVPPPPPAPRKSKFKTGDRVRIKYENNANGVIKSCDGEFASVATRGKLLKYRLEDLTKDA